MIEAGAQISVRCAPTAVSRPRPRPRPRPAAAGEKGGGAADCSRGSGTGDGDGDRGELTSSTGCSHELSSSSELSDLCELSQAAFVTVIN